MPKATGWHQQHLLPFPWHKVMGWLGNHLCRDVATVVRSFLKKRCVEYFGKV